MKPTWILLIFMPTCLFGQGFVEYQSDEYEVSNYHNLEQYQNYKRTTIFTLDFQNREYSYSQKNAVGQWKVTTYRIRDFYVDEDGNGIIIIRSAGLDKVIMNDFKKTITFEFFDGGYCEFLRVRKLQ